jgi:hypothetical protein
MFLQGNHPNSLFRPPKERLLLCAKQARFHPRILRLLLRRYAPKRRRLP